MKLVVDFSLDKEKYFSKIRLQQMPECRQQVDMFVQKVLPLVKPRVLVKLSRVETSPPRDVWIDQEKFSSRVLAEQVENLNRVFPYVATCGREIHDYPVPADRFLERYWLDCLQELALESAIDHLHRYIAEKYAIGKYASMNPGSATAEVWPIEQQAKLFQLLGDAQRDVGVELTPSFLMVPYKSVSGILFETDKDFCNCHLCPRKACRQRKAPYRGAGGL